MYSFTKPRRTRLQAATDTLRDATRTGKIDIAIGASVIALAGGVVTYDYNIDRETNVAIAFSEIGKTIRAYEAEGKQVPPLTLYYSKLTDTTMRVFESRNMAYARNRSNDTFARELEERIDKSLRIHTQISETAKEFPTLAAAALKSVEKYGEAASKLPAVTSVFNDTWSDNHRDVTHEEPYTVTSCDSKNVCTTSTQYKTVYDYTVHTYAYHPQAAQKADQALRTYLQEQPDISIPERLVLAKSTDIDNEYAIERSMKKLLNGKIPTPQQSLQLANTWATASSFAQLEPVILGEHAALKSLVPNWQKALTTSRNQQYNTTSHDDDGPAEFQLAKSIAKRAEHITESANHIRGGMAMASGGVPQLEKTIREFVAVTLDGKPGNATQLHRDVSLQAIQLYEANFINGLNINPFSWGEVVLSTLAGSLLGGAAGFGVGHYRTRKTRLSNNTAFRRF